MDELLRPLSTKKKVQTNIEKFESLSLKDENTKGNTRTKSSKPLIEVADDNVVQKQPALIEISTKSIEPLESSVLKTKGEEKGSRHDSSVFLNRSYLSPSACPNGNLPDDALAILRSQPGIEHINAVLQYLEYGIEGRHNFNVRVTSPKAALLIQALITITVPDIWTSIKEPNLSKEEFGIRDTLLSILSSVGGLESLCGHIQSTIRTSKDDRQNSAVWSYLDILSRILRGRKTILAFINDGNSFYEKGVQRRLFSLSITSLFGGGKILGTAAQAVKFLNSASENEVTSSWIGDGPLFCGWLAQNIAYAAIHLASDDTSWTWLTQILKRGLSLGHREKLVSKLYNSLLLGQRALWTPLHRLLRKMTDYDQRVIMESILLDLSRKYFEDDRIDAKSVNDPSMINVVSGAAAMIRGLVDNNETLEEVVMEWVSISSTKYATTSLGTRRALIAYLALSEVRLERILEKTLASFGDKLQIQHASVVQQETLAQNILLILGHANQLNPSFLRSAKITSLNMQAISNRLSCSVPRSRFLGMIVGVAISRFLDAPDKALNFGVEEMESEEATDWLNLVNINDKVGDLSQLEDLPQHNRKRKASTRQSQPVGKLSKKQTPAVTSKIISIEEVQSSEDEEEDLIPYQKPEDDPEDSDEDPTLIDRNKPTAPIYIIDLIKQLQLTDKPDITSLALKTAPSLIRRKANFGSEVSDNVHALVSALINLQEGMSKPDQQQLRLESLISCLIARPEVVGKYLSHQYFHSDFSISQRTTILTVLGLGARELAGFSDHGNMSAPDINDAQVSKALPPRLQSTLFAATAHNANPISTLANEAAHNTIRPMALAAADTATGPSALKIRTFSSRMDVEKRRTATEQQRTKKIPRTLHSILTKSFYIPLCAPMALLLQNTRIVNVMNSTIMHPSTFRMFLQTLTLLLNTLGPLASTHLDLLTRETLLLLTSLHNNVRLVRDPVVLPAALHLFLSLLDITIEVGVTAQEQLIVMHGRQVAELVHWVNGLSEEGGVVVAAGEGEVGASPMSLPWTVLAAGIAVKWVEMGRKFQGRMLGLNEEEWDAR